MILNLICAAVAAAGLTGAADAQPASKGEWLQSFTAVEVSAPVDIRFVRVPETEAPRIEYDTKGSYTTKFRAEVKDKVLRIAEKADARRPERTTVVVYYNELQSLSLIDAAAVLDGTFSAVLLDLNLAGKAALEGTLDVKDLRMDLSGHSTATLSGAVRYLSLVLSTGTFAGRRLETMSASVNASNSGSAVLWVTDRLEARTSTGGQITFYGNPSVLRGASKFLGGAIKQVTE